MRPVDWLSEMHSHRLDPHRAIVSSVLVFSSLCSINGAKAQSNSIRWLWEDGYTAGAAHIHTQHWSGHMGSSEVGRFPPACNVTWMSHEPSKCVRNISGMCMFGKTDTCEMMTCEEEHMWKMRKYWYLHLHISINIHISYNTAAIIQSRRLRHEGPRCEWEPNPPLTFKRDTRMQSQTARYVWCPSWPDIGWHSPRCMCVCVSLQELSARQGANTGTIICCRRNPVANDVGICHGTSFHLLCSRGPAYVKVIIGGEFNSIFCIFQPFN